MNVEIIRFNFKKKMGTDYKRYQNCTVRIKPNKETGEIYFWIKGGRYNHYFNIRGYRINIDGVPIMLRGTIVAVQGLMNMKKLDDFWL